MTTEDIANEVRAVRRVCTTGHRNIVQIYADWEETTSIEHRRCWCIVMELCSWSFESFLDHEAANVTFWEDWFGNMNPLALNSKLQILEGVSFIHSLDEIHRDLKPANGTQASRNCHSDSGSFGYPKSPIFIHRLQDRRFWVHVTRRVWKRVFVHSRPDDSNIFSPRTSHSREVFQEIRYLGTWLFVF